MGRKRYQHFVPIAPNHTNRAGVVEMSQYLAPTAHLIKSTLHTLGLTCNALNICSAYLFPMRETRRTPVVLCTWLPPNRRVPATIPRASEGGSWYLPAVQRPASGRCLAVPTSIAISNIPSVYEKPTDATCFLGSYSAYDMLPGVLVPRMTSKK